MDLSVASPNFLKVFKKEDEPAIEGLCNTDCVLLPTAQLNKKCKGKSVSWIIHSFLEVSANLLKQANIIKKLIPFFPAIEISKTCALSDNIFKAIKELKLLK